MTKIFPWTIIVLNAAAAIVYLINGNIRIGVYWLAAMTLNLSVTL
jgi:hypothetical protein